MAGCPVIISDCTPWKNLEIKKAGWDIPLKDKIKFLEIIQMVVNTNNEEFLIYRSGCSSMANDFIENSTNFENYKSLFN